MNGVSMNDLAYFLYTSLVAMYARGFGEETAHVVVGNALLAIVVILTCIGAWFVFNEVATLGFKLLRLIVLSAIVLLLASKSAEVFNFLYPSDEDKRQVQASAMVRMRETWQWLRVTLSPL